MRRYSKYIKICFSSYLFWLWLCVLPPSLLAGAPTDVVKKSIDSVLEVSKSKNLSSEEKREKVLSIVNRVVDWREISKRVLGIHWRRRTPQEREEFCELFKNYVENSYADKFEKYSVEKIVYKREKIENNYAIVEMEITTKENKTISMLCKLFKNNGEWLIYDILIEGVSMVNNYRVQVNEIIVSSSYKDLIDKLKSKKEQSS